MHGEGILTSTRVKAKLFRIFKKTKNPTDYAHYKYYRDMINSLCRKSKKQYNKEYFAKHANNLKKTWNGINNLLNRQGKGNVADIFLNIESLKVIDMHNVYNYSFIEKKLEIYAIINKTFTLSCKLIFKATKLSFPSLIQQ